MRKLLCLVLLYGALSRLYGEETLPKITPATLSEIQRLAITLRIAEFPLTQQEYRTHLALPPFRLGMGVGGKKIRSHQICELTDPNDPLGYYGFNIYWGKRQEEPPFCPLIEEIELFFQPGHMGGYPPTRRFVLVKDTAASADPERLAFLRAKMRERQQTPGEFVKEWYKKP
jgi:hypothetical protein